MNIAVVGGRLQGVEALSLARRAGYRACLIDRTSGRPAEALADEFIMADACSEAALEAYARADLILPANEDIDCLTRLTALARERALPLAFDLEAYKITMSKRATDALIARAGVTAPRHYPCPVPVIAKPSEGSGSHGVRLIGDAAEAARFAEAHGDWIVEEYVEGRGYSIEVIGEPNNYRTYQLTEIHTDADYDCCRVTCPVSLPSEVEAQLRRDSVKLAESLALRGIMDVEAIYSRGKMYVLELDARLPSQTPTAVERSTGVNFVSELLALFTGKVGFAPPISRERAVCYEQFVIENGLPMTRGERVMAREAPLISREIAESEALTGDRRGIFVTAADSAAELKRKRAALMAALKEEAW